MQLTDKQIAILENDYIKKYFDLAVSTDTGNDADIEQTLKDIYDENKKTQFKFFLVCDSPLQASNAIRYLKSKATDDRQTVTQAMFDDVVALIKAGKLPESGDTIEPVTGYGQFDSYWLPYYDFLVNEMKLNADPKVFNFLKLSKMISYWWTLEDIAIVSRKITEAHIEYKQPLDNQQHPILKYADGYAIYYYDGRKMTFDEWNEKTLAFRSSLGKVIFEG